jgi:hypothetical protein
MWRSVNPQLPTPSFYFARPIGVFVRQKKMIGEKKISVQLGVRPHSEQSVPQKSGRTILMQLFSDILDTIPDP